MFKAAIVTLQLRVLNFSARKELLPLPLATLLAPQARIGRLWAGVGPQRTVQGRGISWRPPVYSLLLLLYFIFYAVSVCD